MLVNQTSRIGEVHLVDHLLDLGVNIQKIFAPEHGFRGEADRGASIKDGKDERTGLPIISLYGSKKKPTPADLAGLDWGGIRHTGCRRPLLHLHQQHALHDGGPARKNDLGFLVLDRPNPNGHYVDGPVLDLEYRSFVGMHPVPVVHGMTVGEYAQMIRGEGWLADELRGELKVIPCLNYTHQYPYSLPVKPSPNLPNDRSIYLYPSLCFFEGTPISVGRGTNNQFQVVGHPDLTIGDYYFTPVSMPGATRPVLEGKRCRGFDLTYLTEEDLFAEGKLQLSYLLEVYQHFPRKEAFFLKNGFFDKLAGGSELRQQIEENWGEEEIRASWQEGLKEFRLVRERYLLYP